MRSAFDNDGGPMSPLGSFRLVLASLLVMGAILPREVQAQMPARFYWKTLAGANAVPLIFNSRAGTPTRSTPPTT